MRLQQELQAQVHELTAQLKEASVSAAQHLAQVCCLRLRNLFLSNSHDLIAQGEPRSPGGDRGCLLCLWRGGYIIYSMPCMLQARWLVPV